MLTLSVGGSSLSEDLGMNSAISNLSPELLSTHLKKLFCICMLIWNLNTKE